MCRPSNAAWISLSHIGQETFSLLLSLCVSPVPVRRRLHAGAESCRCSDPSWLTIIALVFVGFMAIPSLANRSVMQSRLSCSSEQRMLARQPSSAHNVRVMDRWWHSCSCTTVSTKMLNKIANAMPPSVMPHWHSIRLQPQWPPCFGQSVNRSQKLCSDRRVFGPMPHPLNARSACSRSMASHTFVKSRQT